MELKEQNILFFTRSTQHGGTENVILQLCEIFAPLVNRIVVASAEGLNQQELDSFGVKYYLIPDIENKSPKTMLMVMKQIKRIVLDEQITVIHTHHRMAAFYVSILRLYKSCIFINTSHNTFFNRKILTRFAYEHCHLIACGSMVKQNLHDYFDIDDVTVIHNAVKPFNNKIVIDEQLKKARSEGGFLIGNIGRLSEQKGMEYFIQAIPSVVRSHPEAKFFIVGAGEDEEKLKNMSRNLPVVFLGYRNDIQNLMTQLDLVVLSSLWEGLPLTPIEAFSVNKTIVATSVDGTLEIVKDGENGLLVEARDADSLAKKICWMIEHPEEKRKMEQKAKSIFDNEFSFDRLSKSYTDYYRSL